MSESIYSVRVWLRHSPRGRWRTCPTVATGDAAANAIAEERRKGKLAGETLTIVGDRNPNEPAPRKE